MKTKRLLAALLLLCLCLSLSACGAKYKDDVPIDKIVNIIDAYIGGSDLAEMNSGYLSGAMHMDPSIFAKYTVKLNAQGVNIDEYGIFRAPDAKSVDSVKDEIEDYLMFYRESKTTGIKQYMPEEMPKLEKAEVKVYGIYVLYVIAADDVRENIYKDVEHLLKK